VPLNYLQDLWGEYREWKETKKTDQEKLRDSLTTVYELSDRVDRNFYNMKNQDWLEISRLLHMAIESLESDQTTLSKMTVWRFRRQKNNQSSRYWEGPASASFDDSEDGRRLRSMMEALMEGRNLLVDEYCIVFQDTITPDGRARSQDARRRAIRRKADTLLEDTPSSSIQKDIDARRSEIRILKMAELARKKEELNAELLKKKKKQAEDRKKRAVKKKREAEKERRAAQRLRLITAGLPSHITADYLSRNYSDKEYVELFQYLRKEGAPEKPQNKKDILADIDYLVFTGKLTREDGLLVVRHRDHIELLEPLRRRPISATKAKEHVDYVRWLLIEMGFHGYPESSKKVARGADPDAVAAIDGIQRSVLTRDEYDESERPDSESLQEEEEKTPEKSAVKRRRGRFS